MRSTLLTVALLSSALSMTGCTSNLSSYGRHAGRYSHYGHYGHRSYGHGLAGLLIGAGAEYGMERVREGARGGHRSNSHGYAGQPENETGASGPACGVERWAVKTLRDPEAAELSRTPVNTTVEQLASAQAPYDPDTLRRRYGPVEKTLWRVRARLLGFAYEDDSDYHVVIAGSSGQTMIAEIPSEQCVASNKSVYVAVRRAVRELAHFRPERRSGFHWLDGGGQTPPIITLVGYGYFDRIHGQNGVSPNGVEIHPVLSITPG